MKDKFTYIPSKRKLIVTTEKDAQRLQNPLAEAILGNLPVYYTPITFEFHPADKLIFDKAITSIVKVRSKDAN